MINVKDKSKCCGCTSCHAVCPVGGNSTSRVINMVPDSEGFLYPHVDEDTCKKCGLCDKTCFYNSGTRMKKDVLDKPARFIARHKNADVLRRSQSGGMFAALAKYVLDKNGTIYGASVQEDLSVTHVRVNSWEDMECLHGSKYVQSNLIGIFQRVKMDLLEGLYVLFSGTACQVMGLRNYLDHTKADTKKLILVDIICYGVPSPAVWKSFVEHMSSKNNSVLKSVSFRDKKFGWHRCRTSFLSNKGEIVTDLWTRMWGNRMALRPSCYECRFTNLQRPSDITIGDAWGLEKLHPELDDNKGMSLLMIHSQIGWDVYEYIKNDIDTWDIDIKDYMQPRLLTPTERPANRDDFWKCYHEKPFASVLKIYANDTTLDRVKRCLKQIPLIDKTVKFIKKK